MKNYGLQLPLINVQNKTKFFESHVKLTQLSTVVVPAQTNNDWNTCNILKRDLMTSVCNTNTFCLINIQHNPISCHLKRFLVVIKWKRTETKSNVGHHLSSSNTLSLLHHWQPNYGTILQKTNMDVATFHAKWLPFLYTKKALLQTQKWRIDRNIYWQQYSLHV